MKYFIALFVILAWSTPLPASPDPYSSQRWLTAGAEYYQIVEGDGLEAGLVFSFKIHSVKEGASTFPIIELSNNRHEVCSLQDLRLSHRALSFESASTGTRFYNLTYTVKIETTVMADTGGCLILARQNDLPGADIYKIIHYRYRI